MSSPREYQACPHTVDGQTERQTEHKWTEMHVRGWKEEGGPREESRREGGDGG